MRCEARTRLGSQCKRKAQEGSSYCYQHEDIFGNPEKRLRYNIESIALWVGIIGSFASVIGLAIVFFPSPQIDPKDFVRETLEELVAVPLDEYISLDSRLKKLAEEQGKAPEQLKDEIDAWIEGVKTPYEKGLAALYQQKYQEAQEYLEESIESSKQELAGMYFYLGNAQFGNEEYGKAIDSYRAAISIDPQDTLLCSIDSNFQIDLDNGNLPLNLRQTLEKHGISLSQSVAITRYKTGRSWMIASTIKKRSNSLFREHEYAKSKYIVSKNKDKLDIYESANHMYINLGDAYHELEEYDKAIVSYQTALRIDPYDGETHYKLGDAYYQLEEYDKMIDSYRTALPLDNMDIFAENALTFKNGRLMGISVRFRSFAGIHFAYRYYKLGNAYHSIQNYDKAIDCYQESINYRPDHVDAHYNLGNAYLDIGQYDNAIHSYKMAISITPDYADVHYSLGLAYVRMGGYDSAKKEQEEVIRLDPNHSYAHYRLAEVYALKSKKNLSIKFLKKATTLDENMIVYAGLDKDFDNIRKSPEWKLLVDSIGESAKDAVPALIELLNDGSPRARYNAVSLLTEIGDARAVPALIEALSDRSERVRSGAVEALKEIGTPEALKAVKEINAHSSNMSSIRTD